MKVQKVGAQGLKIYGQDLVVESGRPGEEYDFHEMNAVGSLVVHGGHHTAAAAADYGNIGFEGRLAPDNCSVDKVGIDCASACREGFKSARMSKNRAKEYFTPDGPGTVDHSTLLCYREMESRIAATHDKNYLES